MYKIRKYFFLTLFFYATFASSEAIAEQSETEKINCYSSYIMMNYQKHYLEWGPEEIFQEHQQIIMGYLTEMMPHLEGASPGQIGAMFMGFITNEELWESTFDETFRTQIGIIKPNRMQANFFARHITKENADVECPLYTASKFGR